jgi:hypothetical protein
MISIKSMEGLPAQAEIDVRCCRATRRRRDLESSIRRRDRRRIIGEWAPHRQNGIFGTDSDYLIIRKMESKRGDEYTTHSCRAKLSLLDDAVSMPREAFRERLEKFLRENGFEL